MFEETQGLVSILQSTYSVNFLFAICLYTYLGKEITDLATNFHDFHRLLWQGTRTQPFKVDDIDPLASAEIWIDLLRGPNIVFEAVHEGIPKVFDQIIYGHQAHNSLRVDITNSEVVDGRTILSSANWQKWILTEEDTIRATKMLIKAGSIKVELFGFFEHGLILYTST